MNNEAMELMLVEQRVLLQNAFSVWVGHPDFESLKGARLNGDVLWLDVEKHVWLGVTLTWEEHLGVRIVHQGQMVDFPPKEILQERRVFMRVFHDLAEKDRAENRETPVALRGLRHGCDLNEVHSFYEEAK